MKIHWFVGLFVLLLVGCSTDPTSTSKRFNHLNEAQLFDKAEVALATEEYNDAVAYFEALDARFPFSSYSEQAQIDIIYAYYKTGDKASAAAAADRFIQLYPTNPKLDYVYYMKGLSNYEQEHGILQRYFPVDEALRDPGTALQSYQDFEQLVQRYPRSRYAADARLRMIYLRDLVARHDMSVARYYYQRGAYVAAINRANEIIKRFPQTLSSEQALVILVRSHRKLGMQKEANDALRVLALNFPKSKALARLKQRRD